MAPFSIDDIEDTFIRDPRYLQPEFHDGHIIGREREMQGLSKVFRNLTSLGPGGITLIEGPSGTGKTVLSKSFLDWVNQESQKRDVPLETRYTNAKDRTIVQVFQDFWQSFEDDPKKHFGAGTGPTYADHRAKFRDAIQSYKDTHWNGETRPVLWIIDDYVFRDRTPDALNHLLVDIWESASGSDDAMMPVPLDVVFIGNHFHWCRPTDSADQNDEAQLWPRTWSRRNLRDHLHFPPYTQSDLAAIVQYRADKAIDTNRMDDIVPEILGGFAAREEYREGDARFATELFRLTVTATNDALLQDPSARLTASVAADQLSVYRHANIINRVAHLPEHLAAALVGVLATIKRLGAACTTQQAFATYSELFVDRAVQLRRFRDYLTELQEHQLVQLREGAGRKPTVLTVTPSEVQQIQRGLQQNSVAEGIAMDVVAQQQLVAPQ